MYNERLWSVFHNEWQRLAAGFGCERMAAPATRAMRRRMEVVVRRRPGEEWARTSLPRLRLLHHAVASPFNLSSATGMFDCPSAL